MNLNITRLVLLAALLAPLLAAAGESEKPHWGYDGQNGPDHWGDLSPEFATCKTGRSQSPIDIGRAVPLNWSVIGFSYRGVPVVDMVNNGHTVQVDYPPGSFLTLGEKRYQLRQFHFHTPSEHSMYGQRADMVVHLVHQAADGELAVVAVAMTASLRPNRALSELQRFIPGKAGQSIKAPARFNASWLLPHDRSFFTYSGSLTTPPCTEGVRWVVFREPVRVSAVQLDRFRSVMGENARPVQPLNQRQVYYSR